MDLAIGNVTLRQTRVYQEGLEDGREEGRQKERREFIESALRARFGVLDHSLTAVVDPLLALPPEELAALLINQSREELIARFTPRLPMIQRITEKLQTLPLVKLQAALDFVEFLENQTTNALANSSNQPSSVVAENLASSLEDGSPDWATRPVYTEDSGKG